MKEKKEGTKVTVKWVEGLQFVARDRLNHALVIDSDEDKGGFNAGFRPSQLVLAALAGCTAMDVISILQKKRQQVFDMEVEVTGWLEEKEDYPRPWKKMHVEYRVKGKDVEEEAVKRAIQLSEEKYCTVRATLTPCVEITSSYTISNK